MRGGGGNFGVVTSFEFELHPMQREVVGGDVVFPLERARELLDFYGEYSASVRRRLYVDAIMCAPPGGKPGAFVLSCCCSGPPGEADRVLAPIRKLGKPIADTIQARDYVAVQRMHDRADPRNEGQLPQVRLHRRLQSGRAGRRDHRRLPGRSAARHGALLPAWRRRGRRVPAEATAFPHRHATHNMLTAVTWPLDDRPDAAHGLPERPAGRSLERFTRGYYMNEVADEAQAVVDENYQGNIGRMRAVKKKYDPMNLFRLNANVQPA